MLPSLDRGGEDMDIESIIFIAIVAFAERSLEKKCPRLHRKLQLPTTIVLSILVAFFCGSYVYAIYDVMISSAPMIDKVFFAAFMILASWILLSIAVIEWKRWLKMKNGKK